MNKITTSLIAAITLTTFLLNFTASFAGTTQAALSNETGWRLQIAGLVNDPMNLTLSEITSMPQTSVQTTLYCVDFPNRIVEEGNWTGVQLRYLLEQAVVQPSAIKVALYASDGYTTDLTLEAANQTNVIVAYEKDGVSFGETVRLVVPGRWGYKWISQLTRIELVNYDFRGKWESLGYSDDGTGPGMGGSSIPDVSPIPETTNQQNTTTAAPTTPIPTNSSSPLPTQQTREPTTEGTDTQNSEPLPALPVGVASTAAIVSAATLLLFYGKSRKSARQH